MKRNTFFDCVQLVILPWMKGNLDSSYNSSVQITPASCAWSHEFPFHPACWHLSKLVSSPLHLILLSKTFPCPSPSKPLETAMACLLNSNKLRKSGMHCNGSKWLLPMKTYHSANYSSIIVRPVIRTYCAPFTFMLYFNSSKRMTNLSIWCYQPG